MRDSDRVRLTKELESRIAACAASDKAIEATHKDFEEYRKAFDRKMLVLQAQRRLLDAELSNVRAFLQQEKTTVGQTPSPYFEGPANY